MSDTVQQWAERRIRAIGCDWSKGLAGGSHNFELAPGVYQLYAESGAVAFSPRGDEKAFLLNSDGYPVDACYLASGRSIEIGVDVSTKFHFEVDTGAYCNIIKRQG